MSLKWNSFESFKASRLYCRKCAKSMPVREHLLLILPDKDLYEYLCTGCGESLGQREVSLAEKRQSALHAARGIVGVVEYIAAGGHRNYAYHFYRDGRDRTANASRADQDTRTSCARGGDPARPARGTATQACRQPDQGSGVQVASQNISTGKNRQFRIGAQLKYLKPDLIVVAAYGQILTKDILALPKYGCLNIHASLLPKYRGASPIHAAIAAGEKQSGVTIMWMDEGLDTGDILLQEAVTLRRHETAESLHDRLAKIGADGLIKAIRSSKLATLRASSRTRRRRR